MAFWSTAQYLFRYWTDFIHIRPIDSCVVVLWKLIQLENILKQYFNVSRISAHWHCIDCMSNESYKAILGNIMLQLPNMRSWQSMRETETTCRRSWLFLNADWRSLRIIMPPRNRNLPQGKLSFYFSCAFLFMSSFLFKRNSVICARIFILLLVIFPFRGLKVFTFFFQSWGVSC